MRKIAIIMGTRPEVIKLAPVVRACRGLDRVETHVCATAQHRELLDQMLGVFDLAPDADLALMKAEQSLPDLTARAVMSLADYYRHERPDLVLVQGDTTTAFCASLAAFYEHIPIGHVEAGLRTGHKEAPFPEEINRVLISHLTDLHFAPTEWARQNLLREGIVGKQIYVTGNTVVDALLWAVERIKLQPECLDLLPAVLRDPVARAMVLITGHRRENIGAGFEAICEAISTLAESFPDHQFVYPVHFNPQVRKSVYKRLSARNNLLLIEPLAYLPFVYLMHRAVLILSDSGGVQEEATSLGKTVLVMREYSERPEGIASGFVKLVGTDVETIVREARAILSSPLPARQALKCNPYGDGHAGERIAQICGNYLNGV